MKRIHPCHKHLLIRLLIKLCRIPFLNLIEIGTEIETKPLVTAVAEFLDSSENSKNFASTVETLSQQPFHGQTNQNPNHICEFCSHAFRTVEELNFHLQQGCEGLIEMSSIAMDCKPTAVDFTISDCDMKTDEIQTVDDDDDVYDDGLNDINEQSKSSKSDADACEGKKLRSKSKRSQNKRKSHKAEQLDGPRLSKQYPCNVCGKVFNHPVGLASHHRHRHTGPREPRVFKCSLCVKV